MTIQDDQVRFLAAPRMKFASITDGLSYDDVLLQPQLGKLSKRSDADTSTSIFGEGTDLGIPIMSANMPSVTEGAMAEAMAHNGGIGVIHRFQDIPSRIIQWKQAQGKAIVSIGLKDGVEGYKQLRKAGVVYFCIDVAHGHHVQVGQLLDSLNDLKHRQGFEKQTRILVGNVATVAGVLFLAKHKADAIKVGIGPGAACRTREVTGFGVPQLTAVVDCVMIAREYGLPVIADGGIRNSGDIVKALAAGAAAVMIGSMLAGADEAPHPGEYYGNASNKLNGHRAPEGVHGEVPLTGPVEDMLKELVWGIRSGISYAGATNIHELQKNAVWIKLAPGVSQESHVRI